MLSSTVAVCLCVSLYVYVCLCMCVAGCGAAKATEANDSVWHHWGDWWRYWWRDRHGNRLSAFISGKILNWTL